jgi:hypothetical protein
MGTMYKELAEMRKTYKTLEKYNEKQIEVLMALCPYQKKDKVKLVKRVKYFPEVELGSVATVTGVDWNEEYNYILSVSFPHIPKRYFWMPAYLFRSVNWVEKKDTWSMSVGGFDLLVKKVDGKFTCSLSRSKIPLSEFYTDTLDNALDTLESVCHSFRITHR